MPYNCEKSTKNTNAYRSTWTKNTAKKITLSIYNTSKIGVLSVFTLKNIENLLPMIQNALKPKKNPIRRPKQKYFQKKI
jgi:hypothetical protein